MWSDGTPYDHVYVKWSWAAIERDVIYQASKLAVNFESNITFASHAIIVEEYEIQIDDECHKEIMQFCMDNSDKPYGIKEIFGFAYMKICKQIGQIVNNPFPTYGASFVCSKIAAQIVKMTKVVVVDMKLDNIDPLDLNKILNVAGIKRVA